MIGIKYKVRGAAAIYPGRPKPDIMVTVPIRSINMDPKIARKGMVAIAVAKREKQINR